MSIRQGRKASLFASSAVCAGMAAGGLFALAPAQAAHAQSAAPAAAAAAAGDPLSEVVVTAPRQEVKARQVQMQAPNLIQVQSAETIAKYPDFNAAEALGRIPGVSLSSDTGEGRFVQIRGIDANLNGATYGGVPLLNTNPGGTAAGGGGRAVEFDTIPTGAIDGIVVTLTGLPDHEAEGLGGSVELSPRTAANITKPFVDATLGWGDEPLHNHTGPFDAELAVGARFGFGEHGLITPQTTGEDIKPRVGFFSNPTPFSIVLSASDKTDRRAIDDLEEGYLDDGVAPSNGVSEYDLRRYDYHRVRFGYGGDFEFQPNEDHTYYLRGDMAGYTEAVHKNFLLFKKMGDPTVDPSDASALSTTTLPEITLTDERETHRNQVYVIGGRDVFGNAVIDYHAAYSRATYDQDHNIGAKFYGPKNTPIDYDNTTTPNYPIFILPNGINLNDPTIYKLNSLSNSQEHDVDEEYSYALNASFGVHLINDNDRLKFGAEARLRDKVANQYQETYDVPALSLASLSTPALTYYAGHYTNGLQISVNGVRGLITSGVAVLDPGNSGFQPGSYFNAKEDVYAAYGQYTTEIGKWGLLAGVRVEATDARYGGYVQTNTTPNTVVNTLEYRSNDYVNAFPTLQVRYSFTPQIIGRATYSTGIGRPGFTQNSTAASVDLTQSPVVITRGNPNLKPTLGQNFDLSLEDYLPNGGVIQAGLFDKEFTNYIAPRIQNDITTDPLAPGQTADVTTYLNIPKAYARGIEGAVSPEIRLAAQAAGRPRAGGQRHLGRLPRHRVHRGPVGDRQGRSRAAARDLGGDLEPGRLLRGLWRADAHRRPIRQPQPVRPGRAGPLDRHHPGQPADARLHLQLQDQRELDGLFQRQEPAQHAAALL